MADIFAMNDEADMEDVKRNLRKTDEIHNKYRFSRCIDRNVVLIGRSRTGKSTLAKVIEDIFFRPERASLYSETQDVQFHKVATDDTEGNRYYFNIVDTPGFFESTTGQQKPKTKETIKGFIDGCIANDVTNVHLFALVFSLSGRINDQDIETMKFIKYKYPNLGKHMALVVTHCEQIKAEARQELIDEFFRHREVQRNGLREYFGQGVFFMGCFRYESFQEKNDKAIYFEYRNILEMRTAFIKKCIECNDTYNVHKDTSCTIL